MSYRHGIPQDTEKLGWSTAGSVLPYGEKIFLKSLLVTLFSDSGVTMKIPYEVDALLHRPGLYLTFPIIGLIKRVFLANLTWNRTKHWVWFPALIWVALCKSTAYIVFGTYCMLKNLISLGLDITFIRINDCKCFVRYKNFTGF